MGQFQQNRLLLHTALRCAPGSFTFERRNLRPSDVAMQILYCGVCHSDLHQARDDWGISRYPIVPGHEIIGRVTEVGSAVSRYKVGDAVASLDTPKT